MPTQIEVLNGIKAFVTTALLAGTVQRTVLGLENEGAAPDRIPPEGRIVLRRGDPGDPQVDLNPVTYYYEHEIPLEISTTADPVRSMTAAEVAAEILSLISTAILADRTAGGLVDYLDGFAPEMVDIQTNGAPLSCDVQAALTASYSTTSPL